MNEAFTQIMVRTVNRGDFHRCHGHVTCSEGHGLRSRRSVSSSGKDMDTVFLKLQMLAVGWVLSVLKWKLAELTTAGYKHHSSFGQCPVSREPLRWNSQAACGVRGQGPGVW